MAASYDLFISYTQKDGEIAASLPTQLHHAGVTCFMADRSIRRPSSCTCKAIIDNHSAPHRLDERCRCRSSHAPHLIRRFIAIATSGPV